MQTSRISRYAALAAIALFSITFSACGGGGGGGASPPVAPGPGGGSPPPGGGSTPTPAPSGKPTPTPSPTPTAMPTASPTPTPAPPSPSSVTMLPDTNGRFGLIQIFDWDGTTSHTPLSTSQIESEAPHEDAVWGAFNPAAWNAGHPGMFVSRYTLPVQDNNSISGHDLSWFQTNHPTWILYACQSDGTPTHDLAMAPGAAWPDVPLDFSNPAVIDYQINQEIIPYLKAHGYNALAVDNTDLLNYLIGNSGTPDHVQPVSSEYGCGTWNGGTFNRLFGGPYGAKDPNFIAAMVKWVQTAASDLHNAGMKIIINHPLYSAPTDPNESAMVAATDAMVFERGFTDYGKYSTEPSFVNLFGFALTWAQYAQSHHVAFLITDYLCTGWNGTQPFNNNAPCPTDPSQIPAPQVDWALASYALVNMGGADVYISPQTGQMMSYRPEYSTNYGQPCGAYTQLASYVYERKFQGALVLVNSGTSPYSASLPTSHTYRDIEGRAVSNPLTLGPTDGYVLLTSNGCS